MNRQKVSTRADLRRFQLCALFNFLEGVQVGAGTAGESLRWFPSEERRHAVGLLREMLVMPGA